MKKIGLTVMLLVILVLNGCTTDVVENEQQSSDTQVEQDAEHVQDLPRTESREFDVSPGEHGYLGVQWIEHMNDYLPSRLAFSDRELETAEWIATTLIDMGFDEEQVEIQTFAYETPTSSWWKDASRMIAMYESMGYYNGLERIDYSQNVILTIPGRSEETIIIGAHYDGVGYPGISDNASGTVLLLENAYHMQNIDHYYTLQYVFFGAEEVGLIGSFYFVDHMTQEEIDHLVLMINSDVIMDGPELIYAVAYLDEMPEFPEDILWDAPKVSQNDLTDQVEEIADRLNAQRYTELISKPHAIVLPTDQLAFIQFGVPVMLFYSTHSVEYPETFEGDVLHTKRDCLDFLMENHPGRVERALYEFGLFLEEVVSSEFVQ
jgi:hypothetical protein